MSFNFTAAITICSDFGAPKNKVWHGFHCFSIYFPWNDGTRCHDLHFLNWALSQLFHSPLSLSQPWDFFGRKDTKPETPVLWPPHVKSWLIGKDSDAGRDGGQEEKGMTEDEMAGWHHWLNGRESEWTPGVGDGQGGLACCNSWGHKESDTTEWLNWTRVIE